MSQRWWYSKIILLLLLFAYASILFPPKMPDIRHCSYFAKSWKNTLHLGTSLFGIMEIVFSKIFKMSISRQDVYINRNLQNDYSEVNTDL